MRLENSGKISTLGGDIAQSPVSFPEIAAIAIAVKTWQEQMSHFYSLVQFYKIFLLCSKYFALV